MTRRPKVKQCADPGCPLTFTGRGRYCEKHRAGRDKPGSDHRRGRNREAQRRRRDKQWVARYRGVITTVTYPQVRGSKTRGGPLPIDVTGTPGYAVIDDAIDDFLASWGCDLRGLA